MQDYKRTALLEADLHCSKVIQGMETKLRAACHAPDAKLDDMIQVRHYLSENMYRLMMLKQGTTYQNM